MMFNYSKTFTVYVFNNNQIEILFIFQVSSEENKRLPL